MPLRKTAKKVMSKMKKKYGDKKGKQIFYATANKQGRKPETWAQESFENKLKEILED